MDYKVLLEKYCAYVVQIDGGAFRNGFRTELHYPPDAFSSEELEEIERLEEQGWRAYLAAEDAGFPIWFGNV